MSYENDNDIIAIAIVSLCWHRRICLAIVSLNYIAIVSLI